MPLQSLGINQNKTDDNEENMSSTTNNNRSRFGFHPCNKEFFLKLKYLHKRYWETLRAFHCWHRWNNKEPQNRNGDEPSYCTEFVTTQFWRKPVTRKGENHFKLYPRTVVDHDVVRLFNVARVPSTEPVEPFSKDQVERIESLFLKVNEYDSN